MKKNGVSVLLCVAILCGWVPMANTQMTGDNYAVTTSVFSGGGEPAGSENYDMNATIGQPSPLMNPSDPPWSTDHWLFSGFWYTLEAGLAPCQDLPSFAPVFGTVAGDPHYSPFCDRDGDDDVDGIDLEAFVLNLGS